MVGARTSPESFPIPYAPLWNLLPLAAGLADPFVGLLGKMATIFWRPRLPACADTSRRRARGLAVVLGGIEGPSFYNYSMAMGLLRGGFRGAVVRFSWNTGIFGIRSLTNLVSRRHHEHQSNRLIETILRHQREYPGTPVCLLAQSGGCWIMIRALEKLPAHDRVHAAVLLSPSISPAHDLRDAASKCVAGLSSIGAPGDYFFLGLGTLIFGTSDRVFSPSAGFVGWHHHPAGFTESRWHPAWARFGYFGNHTSASAARFIQRVIAPLLRGGLSERPRRGARETPAVARAGSAC